MSRWVEVGQPSPERVKTACRKANQVTLFLYGKRQDRWLQANINRLGTLDNLTITPLPENLLDPLANELKRTLEWSLTVTDGMLYLDTADAHHQLQLTCLVQPGH
ncbi:hypothetical protein BOW51_11000 [Solemya velesiana gill symbiont]|uniref:YaeQ family protein n=2 Tax=Solemya velesiana gill symbiont TaxID=1918948 RepID=A0A1T2KS14_9GAMM|nr:hypothetical protein BOW51_11000 [Solemya velesiana gill symbiont]